MLYPMANVEMAVDSTHVMIESKSLLTWITHIWAIVIIVYCDI